jgi:hypothetical protein
MSAPPVKSRFNIHRFTVEVEAVDERIEGEPDVTLANEIASNLESLDGIGSVTVTIGDPEP